MKDRLQRGFQRFGQRVGHTPGLVFVALGLVASVLIRVRGGDRSVHLGFALALAAFWSVGTAVEQLWGGRLARGWRFPFHRVVLGQLALVLYFYVRSGLSHLLHVPGVTAGELYLLATGALLFASRRRGGAGPASPGGAPAGEAEPWWPYALAWAAWWASTFTFLGYQSGQLSPVASDPDNHAFMARLTDLFGRIAYTQQPYSGQPVSYPAGFAVLNTVWMKLSGVSAAVAVNCQAMLQACLMVGLILDAMVAVARGPALGSQLLLLGLAHWLFILPVHPVRLYLEGTARLAHKALALLPLTLVLRLQDAPAPAARLRQVTLWVCALCLGWALITNPAHVLVEAPVLLATLLLALATFRSTGPAARPRVGAWALVVMTAGLALGLLLLSDPWLLGKLVPGQAAPAAGEPAGTPLPLARIPQALQEGLGSLRDAPLFGLIPNACARGGSCLGLLERPATWLFGLVYATAALALGCVWRWRRRADGRLLASTFRLGGFAILALAVATWASHLGAGAMTPLMHGIPGLMASLLRSYTIDGMRDSTVSLSVLLLGLGLVLWGSVLLRAVRRVRGLATEGRARAAVAAGTVLVTGAALAAAPSTWRGAHARYSELVRARRPANLGPIEPVDLAFLREAEKLVPPSERVLLPSVSVRANGFERWLFAVGSMRAVPLYSDLDFAFFHGWGDPAFDQRNYLHRVCQSFDLPWLVAHGVRWVVTSPTSLDLSCLYEWAQVRERYFEERLRMGDRMLYRVRDALLAEAASDPLLNLPLASPRVLARPAAGVQGAVDESGPSGVKGWACAVGTDAPVTVELELQEVGAPAKTWRELRLAARPRETQVAKTCRTAASAHGFWLSAQEVPAGTYRARVRVHSAQTQQPTILGEPFTLSVDH